MADYKDIKSDKDIERDMKEEAYAQAHICDGACMCCPDSDGCELFDGEHCGINNCKQCSHFGVCEERS